MSTQTFDFRLPQNTPLTRDLAFECMVIAVDLLHSLESDVTSMERYLTVLDSHQTDVTRAQDALKKVAEDLDADDLRDLLEVAIGWGYRTKSVAWVSVLTSETGKAWA